MNEAGGLGQSKRAFSNWRHNAIVLRFPNGNSISTVWGYGSITKDGIDIRPYRDGFDPFRQFLENDEAEVMVNCGASLREQLHAEFEGDGSVIGYLSITDWLTIVNAVAGEAKEVDAGT